MDSMGFWVPLETFGILRNPSKSSGPSLAELSGVLYILSVMHTHFCAHTMHMLLNRSQGSECKDYQKKLCSQSATCTLTWEQDSATKCQSNIVAMSMRGVSLPC